MPPVTTPDGFTDAVAELPLLHTPPPVVWVRFVVMPSHTLAVPPIGAGVDNTVILYVL